MASGLRIKCASTFVTLVPKFVNKSSAEPKVTMVLLYNHFKSRRATCISDTCRNFEYAEHSKRLGRQVFKFAKCRRKRWKVTKKVEACVLRRLKALRQKCVCTSTTLHRELKKEMDVSLECSTIRKILARHGYKWRPRYQKPLVDKKLAARRLVFARAILRLSRAALRAKLCLSLDGVILQMPPKDPTDRANHCLHGNTHMYRLEGEAASPQLAGEDPYPDQVPLARSIPMWGASARAAWQS